MDQNKEPPRIIFEGEESQHSARSFNSENPKIVQWVIKYSGGYIKNEKQAQYVLLGLASLFLIISIFLLVNTFVAPSKPPAGYRGNTPDLPEYNNSPTPQDFR